jgi:hypothetical protein
MKIKLSPKPNSIYKKKPQKLFFFPKRIRKEKFSMDTKINNKIKIETERK